MTINLKRNEEYVHSSKKKRDTEAIPAFSWSVFHPRCAIDELDEKSLILIITLFKVFDLSTFLIVVANASLDLAIEDLIF